MENKKAPKGALETEEKLKLIFSKAKELCNLVGTMNCDMCITINGDYFWISQLYDQDSSFIDESDYSDYDGGDRGDNGNNRGTK